MKPILFNADMVRAILDDRKTVARRVVKPKPAGDGSKPEPLITRPGYWNTWGDDYVYRQPYRTGDILYVREKWRIVDYLDGLSLKFEYEADGEISDFIDFTNDRLKRFLKYISRKGWCPKIFMPREAARIFLRVMDVRVERLRDITDDSAMQGGIQYTDFGTYLPNWKMSIDGGKTFHNPRKEIHHPGYHIGQADTPDQCYPTARGAYHALWNSTIKKVDRDRYGWEANPWVRVIEFGRISREEALANG